MRFEDYTEDAICTAMGVGPFEPAGAPFAIRVVLMPSFRPEVCITLERTRLSIVALRSSLWREPVACRLPEYSETVSITSAQFETAVSAFHRAVAEHATQRKSVCLDGMEVSAILSVGEERLTFHGQPLGKEQAAFVSGLLWLAHNSASLIQLRNRVAECGGFVDRAFKIEPEPKSPDMTRIMVLGSPDERAEYLAMLQRRTSGLPST